LDPEACGAAGYIDYRSVFDHVLEREIHVVVEEVHVDYPLIISFESWRPLAVLVIAQEKWGPRTSISLSTNSTKAQKRNRIRIFSLSYIWGEFETGAIQRHCQLRLSVSHVEAFKLYTLLRHGSTGRWTRRTGSSVEFSGLLNNKEVCSRHLNPLLLLLP
jgi:hypothetical protein